MEGMRSWKWSRRASEGMFGDVSLCSCRIEIQPAQIEAHLEQTCVVRAGDTLGSPMDLALLCNRFLVFGQKVGSRKMVALKTFPVEIRSEVFVTVASFSSDFSGRHDVQITMLPD